MSTVVAIKGTNGSGKSTAVRALLERLERQSTLRATVLRVALSGQMESILLCARPCPMEVDWIVGKHFRN